jgi:ABC-type tungstate transport system permease subunit
MKTFVLKVVVALLLTSAFLDAKEEPLKVAIIGGMISSGLWQKVADAFEKRHGIKSEVVIAGNKKLLDPYVRSNSVDFITMHSSDTISNLVADGLFESLTPWTRNSQMIVGSTKNPAMIKEEDSLKVALKKIKKSGASFLVPPSSGTIGVFHHLESKYDLDSNTIYLNKKRGFLKEVAKHDGYTLFGVIPYLLKKHSHHGVVGYYSEDDLLKRPYLASIASKTRTTQIKYKQAKKLLEFLLSDEVQTIVVTHRIEGFEKYPLFFAVKNRPKE